MKFRITHTTLYSYSQAVGLCQNQARLQPRQLPGQKCLASQFLITPEPKDFREFSDYFGNRVAYFAIQQAHRQLMVTATSEVQLSPSEAAKPPGQSWEAVRDFFQGSGNLNQEGAAMADWLSAKALVLDSAMATTSAELAEYAQASFLPGRALWDTVLDLTCRIYTDFTYDPASTTIATPLSQVLQQKRGVCQDFAHLAIACLRCFGIPARYVSGYLETLPASGTARLVGADASHAWFAVYFPDLGWQDFDPTNNKIPYDQHITLAWGRDFADVTPLKGIAFGGGQHTLSVSVDVLRLPSNPADTDSLRPKPNP